MRQGVSLITLGVADLAAARAFYGRLGWREAAESQDSVVFFQANGFVLGLFGQEALTADIGGLDSPPAPGGITIGQNLMSRAAVDEMIAAFEAAGGRTLRAPKDTHWGGYVSYAADPDGHVWEFSHVPEFLPEEDGGLILPSARAEG